MRSGTRLSAFILLVALAAGCSGKAAPEPIWVGHLAPLNGPRAAIGKHAEQGTQLAVEEANQDENRIAGRPVAVRHVDTDSDPKGAAVRLVTVNKVAALLGNLETGPAEALGLQIQSYKVPAVVTAGLAGPPTSKYLFAIGLTPATRGQALARFVAEKLQKTPVAVLAPDRGPTSEALVDAFAAKLGRNRVKNWSYLAANAEERQPSREADVDELAKNVKGQKPQAILVVGTAGDCLRLRTALRKAGLDDKVPILFGGNEEQLTALQAAGQAVEGICAIAAFAPEAGKTLPRVQAFVSTYQTRFGEAPDANAALAYDGARLLFEAMRRAKSSDGDKVQEQLTALVQEFETLTGPLGSRPAFVVQIKGGRADLLERYESR